MTDLTAESNSEELAAPAPIEDTGEAPGEPQKANREARYRVERNEAREALSASQERLARLQTAECYRLAREAGLSVGADLMLAGMELSQFLTEDGLVDSAVVEEAAKAVLAERPQLRKNAPAFDPTQGTGGQPKNHQPSWGSLFRQ